MARRRPILSTLFDPTVDVGMTVPQMRRGEATVNGALVRIPHWSHRILVVLMLNRGRLIKADELISRIWPNPDEEPNRSHTLLTRGIQDLRRYGIPIETLHGRGYRLVITEK